MGQKGHNKVTDSFKSTMAVPKIEIKKTLTREKKAYYPPSQKLKSRTRFPMLYNIKLNNKTWKRSKSNGGGHQRKPRICVSPQRPSKQQLNRNKKNISGN